MSEFNFPQMEKWYPDVNWLTGIENNQGYGFCDYYYVGLIKGKVAVATFSSGSCDWCGYREYEKDSIEYNEFSEINYDVIFAIVDCLRIDINKTEVVKDFVDKMSNITGYKIPISEELKHYF